MKKNHVWSKDNVFVLHAHVHLMYVPLIEFVTLWTIELAVSPGHPTSKNLKVTSRLCWESSPRAREGWKQTYKRVCHSILTLLLHSKLAQESAKRSMLCKIPAHLNGFPCSKTGEGKLWMHTANTVGLMEEYKQVHASFTIHPHGFRQGTGTFNNWLYGKS